MSDKPTLKPWRVKSAAVAKSKSPTGADFFDIQFTVLKSPNGPEETFLVRMTLEEAMVYRGYIDRTVPPPRDDHPITSTTRH